MGSRTLDIVNILRATELENPNKESLVGSGTSLGLDSDTVQRVGLKYYSTLDSLPVTNLTLGLQAFVDENKRQYISDGTGWYNLPYDIGAAPYWETEPDATYTIADSQTPLTVIAKPQDSDSTNFINQSFATDSAQYMVDISIDSSVFTFTPKTKIEIGNAVAAGNLIDSNGDFVYNFKWSDGINVLSKTATITYNPANTGTPFFYSQVRNLTVPPAIAPSVSYRIRGITQDDSDSYYAVGYNNTSVGSGILLKFDDDGDFQWSQGFANAGGTKKIPWNPNGVVMDTVDNQPIVIGAETGYGKNLQQSYMPISSTNQYTTFPAGFQKQFKADGSSEDYTKIFRYSSFPSIGGQWNKSYGNQSETKVRGTALIGQSLYHIAAHDQHQDQTGYFNFYRDVPAIYRTSRSGGISGVYMMRPGTNNNSNTAQFKNKGRVDAITMNALGGNLYLTAETSDGDKEGIIFKMTNATGTPTYAWTRGHAYGKYLSGSGNNSVYESPSSWSYSRFSPVCLDPNDNNLIVTGWMRPGTGTNGNQFSGDAQILLKINDTNGNIIWGKYLDADNGTSSRPYGTMGSVALHNNDYLINVTATTSGTKRCFVKLINISDGTVDKLYELALTGTSSTGAAWTYDVGNYLYRCMMTNSEGLAVMTLNIYGGTDNRISLIKFPEDFGNWTGVHGSESEGNLELTDITDTYTDQDMTFSYIPSGNPLTFGSLYGNFSSYFSSVNYNAGDGYTNQNFTPSTSGNWKVII